MFFKQIVSSGLAHYSYMAGGKGEAVVIDPRRDVAVYMEEARKQGATITAILETHRNEDYIIGSRELADLTGATVYLSGHEDTGYTYGQRIHDGFTLKAGGLRFEAIHTPGHTLGHLSFALYEDGRSSPYMVFTGDSLFAGDLARTDFYGEERLEEMTGLLYDSVFQRLLPLGDEVLVMPAHGAGSVCGQDMEERPYTTLGYERRYNKQLQDESREEFIRRYARMRERPRHFDRMREYNMTGAAKLGLGSDFCPITLEKARAEDLILIDCRSREAFLGGHIPGSLYIHPESLAAYLPTVLEIDTPFAFLGDGNLAEVFGDIYWQSRRIGFERIKGFVADAFAQWVHSGETLDSIRPVSARDFSQQRGGYVLLDVRQSNEFKPSDPQKNRLPIPMEELYDRYQEIPRGRTIYVLCSSGSRSSTAASFLKRHGLDAHVITGGMLALTALGKAPKDL